MFVASVTFRDSRILYIHVASSSHAAQLFTVTIKMQVSVLETRVPGSDLRHLHVLKADNDITGSEVDVAIGGQATFHPHFHCQHVIFVVLQGCQRTCRRSRECQQGPQVQV